MFKNIHYYALFGSIFYFDLLRGIAEVVPLGLDGREVVFNLLDGFALGCGAPRDRVALVEQHSLLPLEIRLAH